MLEARIARDVPQLSSSDSIGCDGDPLSRLRIEAPNADVHHATLVMLAASTAHVFKAVISELGGADRDQNPPHPRRQRLPEPQPCAEIPSRISVRSVASSPRSAGGWVAVPGRAGHLAHQDRASNAWFRSAIRSSGSSIPSPGNPWVSSTGAGIEVGAQK